MNTRKYKYLEAFKNIVVSVVSSRFIVKLALTRKICGILSKKLQKLSLLKI